MRMTDAICYCQHYVTQTFTHSEITDPATQNQSVRLTDVQRLLFLVLRCGAVGLHTQQQVTDPVLGNREEKHTESSRQSRDTRLCFMERQPGKVTRQKSFLGLDWLSSGFPMPDQSVLSSP